jgi:hypothetical protein
VLAGIFYSTIAALAILALAYLAMWRWEDDRPPRHRAPRRALMQHTGDWLAGWVWLAVDLELAIRRIPRPAAIVAWAREATAAPMSPGLGHVTQGRPPTLPREWAGEPPQPGPGELDALDAIRWPHLTRQWESATGEFAALVDL